MRIVILNLSILLSILVTNAQSKVVPIIDIKLGGLLGGVQNGKFLTAKTTIARLSTRQNYTLYLLNGANESLTLKKPTFSMEECPDFYAIEGISEEKAAKMSEAELEKANQEIEKRFERGGVALGEGFKWNPQPRDLETVNLNHAEYKKIVSDYLLTKRIAKHELKLKQAVRVDLEGDGQAEVLIVASRYFPYTQKDGKKAFDEYSVVLMRKIVNGKPTTSFVAGEIYPKNTGDYDGNIFGISSIADLNGDGKMEIVIHSEYYEGNSTDVFEMIGNKAAKIKTLSAGCGV